MKTVTEMAREAGIRNCTCNGEKGCLERFAELVRDDEREKSKWDVHSCGPTCTNAVCIAVREAVEAEREACAKVVWEMKGQCWAYDHDTIAAAIRARGQK